MRRLSGPRLLATTTAVALVAAGVSTLPLLAPSAGAAETAEAPGAPGVASHNGLARKECVGTARNRTSRAWFTIADGVLSDVYAPTVDTTQVQSLQYVVTDGSTFTDLQTRDTTHTVTADASGMSCTVTATARSGRYRLVTRYLTDPARSSVVVRTRYVPLTAAAKRYHLYVRLDASAGGSGGGGSSDTGPDMATVDTSTGSAVPVSYDATGDNGRAYAVPSYLALRADRSFRAVSSGFVGTPGDGLQQLDTSHSLATPHTTATGGNVEQTAELRTDSHGASTLALGFGTTRSRALRTAGATLARPVPALLRDFRRGWKRYDAGLRRPARSLAGLTAAQSRTAARAYYRSANVVKASEDKRFPGALVAGLDAPWGQSITGYAAGYKEIFARDLYEAWTALLTDGDRATARETVRWLLLKGQQANGSQPRNSTLDGAKAPDAFNDQLDETAYPLLMDLQSGLAGSEQLWPHVRRAADFLVSHGPSFGVERWEEQTGYSPSTIAAEIAGLVAAARIAEVQHHPAVARTWRATADAYQRHIRAWGVTTTGSLSDRPYFIRLSRTGDPDAAISYNLGNGGATLDQRDVVDLGFLEYVRLGELSPRAAVLTNSLAVADAHLRRTTANGPGWLRYNADGYGDCYAPDPDTSCPTTGTPWTLGNSGTGHPWPVLGAERAQQLARTGQRRAAGRLLATINRQNSGPGLVPEQVWDHADVPASPYGTDPTTASIGFRNGEADGSASPLSWGSAAQVRLTADLSAGRDLEQPTVVRRRYVTRHQGSTPLTVTAPADQTSVGSSVTVTGTAVPGAVVDVADVAVDQDTATTRRSTRVGRSGTFSVVVPVTGGSNVLVVTSTGPRGGTAQRVRTVVSDVVDGTLLLSQDDPTGDDAGPGTYAYPKAGDFHAGAFDLTQLQAYDTGSTVTFRVRTADLTPTFGSTNGAQLVDLYVHDPAAATTSSAPSYPGMNYTIGSPWSRLIEVQGFGGNKVLRPDGSSAGSVTVSANSVSRYTTFVVDKTVLGGTPGSGWVLTVALTGQDGTHGDDQTRGFTSTPGDYTFGVCATAGTTPACTADPGSVPKVLDTITPSGTSQSDELDHTRHDPVVLSGVTVP